MTKLISLDIKPGSKKVHVFKRLKIFCSGIFMEFFPKYYNGPKTYIQHLHKITTYDSNFKTLISTLNLNFISY